VRVLELGSFQLAMSTWAEVTCPGVEYLVDVEGRIQNDSQALMDVSSYFTQRLYFEFPMTCGTIFNLTVTAHNNGGRGTSRPFTGITGKCVAQHKMYTHI